MKLSVSMSDDDASFIDAYATRHRVASRSGVIQRALALLRVHELGQDYAAAWLEWDDSGDAHAWEAAVGDGARDHPAA